MRNAWKTRFAGLPAGRWACGTTSSTKRLSWPDVVSAGSRGEALAAAARLERTHRPGERFFLERLEASCRYALRNQYTSPILFGPQRPQAALGGMRSSPVEPIIRIDGVQHNLSALVGLLELREGER